MKTTENPSAYQELEKMSIRDLLVNINKEDKTVPNAVEKIIPQLEKFISECLKKMKKGGRLFYIGSGTSGRLGIVDASECPPTYGVAQGVVVGIIAGGDVAIRKAVEFAEDDETQGWKDLLKHKINKNDTVIGITASGSTPYVLGVLKECRKKNILTACITCNKNSEVSKFTNHKLEAVVGPEFVTGSTRMKSGTAQKLILNMISTSLMIQLGHVKGNRMVDMQLSNNKLIDRGTKMIAEAKNISYKNANALLVKHGNVRKAMEAGNKKSTKK